MEQQTGYVFSIPRENRPVAGCTVSRTIRDCGQDYITFFSMAPGTDISAEIYPYYKMILVAEGTVEAYRAEKRWTIPAGNAILTSVDMPIGIRTDQDTVFTEIGIGREAIMNTAIRTDEVFKLAELLPTQDGKIVNMDVIHNDKMKFVVMSFAAGTGLPEHAAPGEALIFALEGEGVITYGGEEHTIRAGENFAFAKGGMHTVRADKPFKMAILLTFA